MIRSDGRKMILMNGSGDMTLSEIFRLTNLINDTTLITIRKDTSLFGSVMKRGKWFEDHMLDYAIGHGSRPVIEIRYSRRKNTLDVWIGGDDEKE